MYFTKSLFTLLGFCLYFNLCAQTFDQSKTYALVVGISDYQDEGIPDLRFADKDAEAFAGFLKSPAGGALDEDHLKILLNEKATAAQFAIALDWLWEVVKENDKVIIYFSGHGDVERKSLTQPGYLLCWDAPPRVYMAGGAFNVRDLSDVVSTLSVQNKAQVILITDACRAGKLSGSGIGGSQATAANLAKQFSNEIKILSCQPDEYSIEGEQWGGGRGAFSYHLLDGLTGMADANEDQVVDLKEIGRYLEDNVTSQVAPQSQNPMTIGSIKEQLTFVFPEILDKLKEGKRGQLELFAATEQRGIEDDVLSEADSSVVEMYLAFKESIITKNFLEPATACTDFYYKKLSKEPQLKALHSSMRRNYAAALQDDAQQMMNTMLKSGLTEFVLKQADQEVIYKNYPSYLSRASELLGKKHYMYNILQARKYFFEGQILRNMKEKRSKYLKALKTQPNMPHAMVELIFCYEPEQIDSSKYYFEKAKTLVPSWVEPYVAMSLLYKDQPDKMEEMLNMAGEVDSTSVLVWYRKARFYLFQRNDIKLGEKFILKVIESTGKDICFPCAYNELGNIYSWTGRIDEAEDQYKKTIQLDTTFATAYYNLGDLYLNTGRNAEAEAPLKKAIELRSDYLDAINDLGIAYSELGRLEESEAEYKKVIEIDSTYESAYNGLGNVYRKKGKFTEAEQYFKKAIAQDKNFWMYHANIALLYQAHQKWEESIMHAQKSVEFGPPIGELVGVLGNAYTHIPNRLNEAKATLDRALEMSPNSPDIYIFLSQWAIMKNQQEKAWEYLSKGLKNNIKKGQIGISYIIESPDFKPMQKEEQWQILMNEYFPEGLDK